jgi:hypothetical protein
MPLWYKIRKGDQEQPMSQPPCIVGMGGAQVADVQIFQMAGALGHPLL